MAPFTFVALTRKKLSYVALTLPATGPAQVALVTSVPSYAYVRFSPVVEVRLVSLPVGGVVAEGHRVVGGRATLKPPARGLVGERDRLPVGAEDLGELAVEIMRVCRRDRPPIAGGVYVASRLTGV